jgi:hypothetical protein
VEVLFYRTRHIGDTIMDDTVFGIDRVVMAGWARCFETSALIDGDIDDDRSWAH